MKIQNSAVLVTGASRGLGAALANELARRGARVVLVARGAEELEETARGIRADGGVAYALAADVAHKRAVYAIAGAAAALAGPISVVVHNASTLGPVPLRPLLDTDCEDLERALAVNLVGPFRITKALAGSMAVRGEGLVVQITSDASINAYPEWGAYGVSKAALDHLGRIWSAELEGTGVRFLTIDPGDMDTQMHRDAVPDADPRTLLDPAVAARRIADIIERAESLRSGGRFEASSLAADRLAASEVRPPEPEDRCPESEDRRAESEDRRAESEDRRPESEDRRPEVAERRPELAEASESVERREPSDVTDGADAAETGEKEKRGEGPIGPSSLREDRAAVSADAARRAEIGAHERGLPSVEIRP